MTSRAISAIAELLVYFANVFLFLRQLKYMLFEDNFLWKCKEKIRFMLTFYLSIFNIGSVLHWLNCIIKALV